MEGKVKFYSAERGWGFITKDNGEDLFFHYSSIMGNEDKTIREGERVSFDEGRNDKGKVATNIMIIR